MLREKPKRCCGQKERSFSCNALIGLKPPCSNRGVTKGVFQWFSSKLALIIYRLLANYRKLTLMSIRIAFYRVRTLQRTSLVGSVSKKRTCRRFRQRDIMRFLLWIDTQNFGLISVKTYPRKAGKSSSVVRGVWSLMH